MSEEPRHPLREAPRHPLRDKPKVDDAKPQPKGVRVKMPYQSKRPYVTYALLAINVVIFLLRFVDLDTAYRVLLWGVADYESIIQNRELYRLFTAMFLHFDVMHIFFNGLALYYIGSSIELIFGHGRFLTIYILGGLAGSVFMLFEGGGGLGASGAVFAIWGAELVFLYQHRKLFGAMAQQRLRSSIIFMGINFLIGITNNVSDSPIRISNAAHIGGLLGGLLLTWLVGPRLAVRPIQNPQPDEPQIELIETNHLSKQIMTLLYYSVGLLALLFGIILLNGA